MGENGQLVFSAMMHLLFFEIVELSCFWQHCLHSLVRTFINNESNSVRHQLVINFSLTTFAIFIKGIYMSCIYNTHFKSVHFEDWCVKYKHYECSERTGNSSTKKNHASVCVMSLFTAILACLIKLIKIM